MTKRLFIFAAYDPDNIIDETLLHYLDALSGLGDIILTIDNDVPDTELEKLKTIPNILHINAARHGEYDFGSYKRGYNWARDKKLLKKYDWVYLVNDSVYGPLWDLTPTLDDLESRGVDMVGLTDCVPSQSLAHVQSYFVGLTRSIANASFFNDFLNSVVAQPEKDLIVLKYELRMTHVICSHGFKFSTIVQGHTNRQSKDVYSTPLEVLNYGVPFIKKDGVANLPFMESLFSYSDAKTVQKIQQNYIRTKSPYVPKRKYKKCFRASLLGIPIIVISRYIEPLSCTTSYKFNLFDIIPLFKISRNTKDVA